MTQTCAYTHSPCPHFSTCLRAALVKEAEERRQRDWRHSHTSRPGVWYVWLPETGFRHWPRVLLVKQTQVNHENREHLRLFSHVHILTHATNTFKSAPVERRAPLHSVGIPPPPPIVTNKHFLFLSTAVGMRKRNVAGRKIRKTCFWTSSCPTVCKMKWHASIPKVQKK